MDAKDHFAERFSERYDERCDGDDGMEDGVIYPGDERELITCTPGETGTYDYVCSVFGQIGRGMWGRFVVEE